MDGSVTVSVVVLMLDFLDICRQVHCPQGVGMDELSCRSLDCGGQVDVCLVLFALDLQSSRLIHDVPIFSPHLGIWQSEGVDAHTVLGKPHPSGCWWSLVRTRGWCRWPSGIVREDHLSIHCAKALDWEIDACVDGPPWMFSASTFGICCIVYRPRVPLVSVIGCCSAFEWHLIRPPEHNQDREFGVWSWYFPSSPGLAGTDPSARSVGSRPKSGGLRNGPGPYGGGVWLHLVSFF